MKKTILLIVLITASLGMSAQNKFNETGNVGVGTLSPTVKLHIESKNVPLNIFPPNQHSDYFKNKDYDMLFLNRVVSTNMGPSIFLKGTNNATSYSARLALLGKGGANADLAFLTSSTNGYKQNEVMRISYNGNVGIGTTTPKTKLDVAGRANVDKALVIDGLDSGSAEVEQLRLNGYGILGNRGAMYVTNQNPNGHINFFSGGTHGAGSHMIIKHTGNVGVGTTNPSTKLHVVGNQNSNWVSTVSNTAAFGHSIYTGYNNGDVTYGLVIEGGKTGIYDIDFAVTNKFYIKGNGNVGIGTKNPDSKLAVNGKIHTKEVKVDLIGWSDFVFEDKYELPTLKEVENHIKENGHLKDIPSTKEVIKNGIYLGEMNSKLLQKIEELTLYTIQQEKKIKQQESNLKMLLKRVEKLERK